MHGYEVEIRGQRLYVGPSPFRKSMTLALITHGGSVHNTVAYFRNVQAAEEFLTAIAGYEIKLENDE